MDVQREAQNERGPADQRMWKVGGVGEQVRIGAAVVVVAAVVLALVGVVGAVLGEPFQVFTKEPVEQFDAGRSYTGFLAHVTWFLWVVGLSLAFFAITLLRQRRPGDPRIGFLAVLCVLTVVLLADDFMMIHDRIFPRVGLPEEGLYVGYAIAFVVLLVRFGGQFRRADLLLALAAGGFWGLSLAMDFVQEHAGLHLHVIEDSAKLIGTALWATFLVRASRSAVLDCLVVTGESAGADQMSESAALRR
jgi:hypothetical protein